MNTRNNKLSTTRKKQHHDGTVVLVLVNLEEIEKKYSISTAGKSFEIIAKAKSFNSLSWK